MLSDVEEAPLQSSLETVALQDTSSKCQRVVGRWALTEDILLEKAVSIYGPHSWKKISAQVPGRSAIQCLHRWTKILKPGLKKGQWSKEEDNKLREWVQTHGPTLWSDANTLIKGRSGKQIRERWFNALAPSLKKTGEWTPLKELRLFKQYEKEGSQWSKIATKFKGQSQNSVKNRFYSILRRSATRLMPAEKRKRRASMYTQSELIELIPFAVSALEKQLQDPDTDTSSVRKNSESEIKPIEIEAQITHVFKPVPTYSISQIVSPPSCFVHCCSQSLLHCSPRDEM